MKKSLWIALALTLVATSGLAANQGEALSAVNVSTTASFDTLIPALQAEAQCDAASPLGGTTTSWDECIYWEMCIDDCTSGGRALSYCMLYVCGYPPFGC